MKSVGDQAQEFRLAKGWNTTRMAREVKTTRQNIENLESRPDLVPRYIKALAKVMGATVDDLLHGRWAYDPKGSAGAPRAAASDAADYVTAEPALSADAIGLAQMFDRLPDDPDLRSRIWVAVMKLMLRHVPDDLPGEFSPPAPPTRTRLTPETSEK